MALLTWRVSPQTSISLEPPNHKPHNHIKSSYVCLDLRDSTCIGSNPFCSRGYEIILRENDFQAARESQKAAVSKPMLEGRDVGEVRGRLRASCWWLIYFFIFVFALHALQNRQNLQRETFFASQDIFKFLWKDEK